MVQSMNAQCKFVNARDAVITIIIIIIIIIISERDIVFPVFRRNETIAIAIRNPAASFSHNI